MSGALVFLAWQRSGVYALASAATTSAPRLQATVHIELHDRDGQEPPRADDAPFEILGPGDVQGLRRAAIRRMVPPPHTADAEVTKCVHVELAAADLPWRYTPEVSDGMVLRPWLVLVVGTPEEIELLPDERVNLAPMVLAAHPLNQSARWAHVQIALHTDQDLSGADPQILRDLIATAGSRPVARLLSPRPLEPYQEYIAAIVPAFTPDGQDSWGSGQTGNALVPLYHHWRFRTGESWDFRALAARLQAFADTGELGRAPLRYARLDPPVDLVVRGAVAPVDSADATITEAVKNDTAALTMPWSDPRGRPIVTAPVYGAAWHAAPLVTHWGEEANTDPRHRGVAGLGAQAGIELQDLIVDAVIEQVGPIEVAAQRVCQLTLGLRAAGSLWRQRLPTHPMRRLWLYGPALGRINTAEGPVLDRITGASRPLSRALFSSAARRILRRGPARTDLAQPQATDPAQILPRANQCSQPPGRTAPGLPSVADFASTQGLPDLEEAVNGQVLSPAILEAMRERAASDEVQQTGMGDMVLQAVEQFEQHFNAGKGLPYVFLIYLLALLDDPQANVVAIREALRDLPEPPYGDAEPGEDLETEPEDRPCEPVNLEQLEEDLSKAIDPTSPDSWVKDRVLDTIDGLEGPDCAPVEVCTSVDLPAWRFLRDVAPDWLLPGVGQLPTDSVSAFESNPIFVAAFMLGLNTQILAELRWRNLPMLRGCTPLRVFWGRFNGAQNQPIDDILGILAWDTAAGLGADQHQPGGTGGSELVLVFRSELFRRYPDTLVSAILATPDFDALPSGNEPRVWPVFQGEVGEDVTFFGLPLTSEQARGYWLVVEEAQSYRFRSAADDTGSPPDGAGFASDRLDDPVRVLIRGDYLIPEMPT